MSFAVAAAFRQVLVAACGNEVAIRDQRVPNSKRTNFGGKRSTFKIFDIVQ